MLNQVYNLVATPIFDVISAHDPRLSHPIHAGIRMQICNFHIHVVSHNNHFQLKWQRMEKQSQRHRFHNTIQAIHKNGIAL